MADEGSQGDVNSTSLSSGKNPRQSKTNKFNKPKFGRKWLKGKAKRDMFAEHYNRRQNMAAKESQSNEKTRDFMLLPPEENPNKNRLNKQKSSKKWLKGKNKNVVYEIHKFQKVLGETQKPTEEELELERTVFGGESDIIEELNLMSPKKKKKKASRHENISSDDDIEERISDNEQPKEKVPAWEDDDDEHILVKQKSDTLVNCHRSISLRGDEKYSEYVQEKFIKLMGQPKWADMEKNNSVSDGDSEDELLQKTGNFIIPSTSLPKGTIDIRKTSSLVDDNSRGVIIKSVEFHQSSKVALVAGLNGTATLYQIDGKVNSKIQSVHFERFPIHTAHFTVDGTEIVAGSKDYGHYFTYDMIVGKIIRIPWERGMEQVNVRRFHMSPDGKYIVIHGLYGHIQLVTAKSKEWIGSMKMNGEVYAITFNRDGSRMYSHGNTGEIFVWDMSTRQCIHKFTDEGCIAGTSLALSPNGQYLAAGSDVGVVNIYDASKVITSSDPVPLKRFMNLTTEATSLKFNCTSELLAMASSHKANAVKLAHFPSMSVFSNFPVREKNMRNINCLDISLNSGYFAVGNNVGSVYLHRLRHYTNY